MRSELQKKDDIISSLKKVCDIKENERMEWAALAVKKGLRIDTISEHLIVSKTVILDQVTKLADVHNLLAKSELDADQYNKISFLLASAKTVLFELANSFKTYEKPVI